MQIEEVAYLAHELRMLDKQEENLGAKISNLREQEETELVVERYFKGLLAERTAEIHARLIGGVNGPAIDADVEICKRLQRAQDQSLNVLDRVRKDAAALLGQLRDVRQSRDELREKIGR